LENKVDGSWAYFWIRGNWSNSNGTQAYMYYGNSTISSTSDGKLVFNLFDDFDDSSINATIWDNTSNVTESGGVINVTGVGGVWRSLNSDDTYGATVCMMGNVSVSSIGSDRCWGFSGGNCGVPIQNFYWNYPTVSNINSLNFVDAPISYVWGTQTGFQRFMICRNGTTSTDYSVNYSVVNSLTSNVTSNSLEGRMDILTVNEWMAADWIFVKNYSYPEPTYVFGSEETEGTNATSINLYLNGTEGNVSYTYENSTNATAVINVTGLWVAIDRNGTLIANGTTSVQNINMTTTGYWNFTAFYTGNGTYQSSSVTHYANITNASSPLVLSNNISWSGGYPNTTNTTGSGCPAQITCNLYRNGSSVSNPENILLGVGTHVYVYNTTGNQNYSSNTTTNNLIISIGDPDLNETFNTSDSVIQGTIVNISCEYPTEITVNHSNDTGSITNPFVLNTTGLLGDYNYTCNNTATSNYSADTDNRTLTVTVTDALIIHRDYVETNLSDSIAFNLTLTNATHTTTEYNITTYNNNTVLGDLTIDYISTDFPSRKRYVIVPAASSLNISIYSLNSSNGHTVSYYVVDTSERPINNVLVTARRLIGASWYVVDQERTDAAGVAQLFLQSTASYELFFNRSGYSDVNSTTTPSESSYKVYMGITGGYTGNISATVWENLSITLAPIGFGLINNTTTFNFTINSSDSQLEWWGLNLTWGNGTLIYSNNTTAAVGGIMTHSVNLSQDEGENITMQVWFKKQNFTAWYDPRLYHIWEYTGEGLESIMAYMRTNMDTFTIGIIAIFCAIAAAGMVSTTRIPFIGKMGGGVIMLGVLAIFTYYFSSPTNLLWGWSIWLLSAITVGSLLYLKGGW